MSGDFVLREYVEGICAFVCRLTQQIGVRFENRCFWVGVFVGVLFLLYWKVGFVSLSAAMRVRYVRAFLRKGAMVGSDNIDRQLSKGRGVAWVS